MPRQNAPFAVRLVGLIPLGVGSLVLAGVWFGFGDVPLDDMPLFGKLFASLVASGFLLVGFAFLTARMGRKGARGDAAQANAADPAGPAGAGDAPAGSSSGSAKGWDCPQCGAPLGDETRISPSGDALCPFCENWFNVQR